MEKHAFKTAALGHKPKGTRLAGFPVIIQKVLIQQTPKDEPEQGGEQRTGRTSVQHEQC